MVVERGSFNRPNLHYSIRPKSGMKSDLGPLFGISGSKNPKASGHYGFTIVYCSTRKETDEVAKFLSSAGVKVAAYHAGLPDAERSRGLIVNLIDLVSIVSFVFDDLDGHHVIEMIDVVALHLLLLFVLI